MHKVLGSLGRKGFELRGWQHIVIISLKKKKKKCKFILTCVAYADLNLVPELAAKLQDIPVIPCFALMLAFAEPLSAVRY